MIEFFIDINIDINPVNRWGNTPLDEVQDENIRKFLIEKGAKKGPGKYILYKANDIYVTEK